MEEPLFRVTTTINRQSILESFWRGRKKNELRNMILGHIVFVIASYLFAELTIRPISTCFCSCGTTCRRNSIPWFTIPMASANQVK